jgi:hypothetical protein
MGTQDFEITDIGEAEDVAHRLEMKGQDAGQACKLVSLIIDQVIRGVKSRRRHHAGKEILGPVAVLWQAPFNGRGFFGP